MSSPHISVLLPTRNSGAYLRESVDSILAQTYPDFELLVIDDHTTDRSLDGLEASDSRLRIIPNKGDGIVDALNTGASQARGELLARMDGDDIALPERFERQIEYLRQNPSVGIAGAQVEIFNEHDSIGGGYQRYQTWINNLLTPEAIAREIFIESPLPHPTVIMKRAVFDQLGGYQHNNWAEDYDLWLRAHSAGIAMGKPEGVLLRWRDWDGRLSRSESVYGIDRFLAAKAYYLARTHLEIRPAIIWGAGETGKQLHDLLREQGVVIKNFIDVDPKKIGGHKRDLPVVGPETCQANEALIVVAVGAKGARPLITRALHKQKLIEGVDYIFVA